MRVGDAQSAAPRGRRIGLRAEVLIVVGGGIGSLLLIVLALTLNQHPPGVLPGLIGAGLGLIVALLLTGLLRPVVEFAHLLEHHAGGDGARTAGAAAIDSITRLRANMSAIA